MPNALNDTNGSSSSSSSSRSSSSSSSGQTVVVLDEEGCFVYEVIHGDGLAVRSQPSIDTEHRTTRSFEKGELVAVDYIQYDRRQRQPSQSMNNHDHNNDNNKNNGGGSFGCGGVVWQWHSRFVS
jgi:ribosomal protein S1